MFKAVLIFAAVLAGALAALFVSWQSALIWGGSVLIALTLLHRWSTSQVRKSPELAVVGVQFSYLLIFLSAAASTYGGVVFAGVVPDLVKDLAQTGDVATVDAVAKVLAGAVSTLIGALWLDNARSTDGSYWPPGAYKRALGKAYRGADLFEVPLGQQRSKQLDRLFSIVYDDRVTGGDIAGWDFAACRARARAVRDLDPTL